MDYLVIEMKLAVFSKYTLNYQAQFDENLISPENAFSITSSANTQEYLCVLEPQGRNLAEFLRVWSIMKDESQVIWPKSILIPHGAEEINIQAYLFAVLVELTATGNETLIKTCSLQQCNGSKNRHWVKDGTIKKICSM